MQIKRICSRVSVKRSKDEEEPDESGSGMARRSQRLHRKGMKTPTKQNLAQTEVTMAPRCRHAQYIRDNRPTAFNKCTHGQLTVCKFRKTMKKSKMTSGTQPAASERKTARGSKEGKVRNAGDAMEGAVLQKRCMKNGQYKGPKEMTL